MTKLRIAIDGPAAAGKSTVAKKIASNLSFVYIDTGAMYRALTLKAINYDIDLHDELALYRLLKSTTITLRQHSSGSAQTVLLDGKDVTSAIRSQAVSNGVSFVAKHRKVREEMVKRQKKLAEHENVVMDGRDIGTHVLPDAEVKIFLVASVDERAKRRYEENVEKGFHSNLNQLKNEIKERDERDTTRETSPLIQAEDAIPIDTTTLSIDEVVKKIEEQVQNYLVE
ncbi:MAG TPA: (d)CMP kinase [Pseudogracilibacillus sp.]|nr:(d)CMP kinase [Pseudogracilibacillus sp.]